MKYRYTASIVRKASAEPVEVSVMARNQAEALENIIALPEFMYITSLPMCDIN